MKLVWSRKESTKTYWETDRVNVFEPKFYKPKFKRDAMDRFYDHIDKLCYNVRRGLLKLVQTEVKQYRKFETSQNINDDGDQILHLCAEYNQIEIF